MGDEDEKLLRTWKEIAERVSAEQEPERLMRLAQRLDKALRHYSAQTANSLSPGDGRRLPRSCRKKNASQ